VYPAGACLGIPDLLRDKYFEPRNDHWVAKPALRDAVTFAPHDLLADAPFTQISLIVCRNTLIYLTADARRHVLSRLRLSLRAGGFLFLGPSEVASDALAQFRPLDQHGSVLVARGSVVGGGVLSVMKDLAPEVPAAVSPPQRSARTTESLYEAAVQLYAPPGVAVDSNFELLQVFGRVADFVSVPPGRVTVSLLKMVPRSLAVVLGTAGRKVLRNGEQLVIPEVRVTVAGVEHVSSVRIVPVDDLPGVTLGLMIFFESPEQPKQSPQIDPTQLDKVAQHRLKELEDELVLAREHSSSAMAELESTNQELQAANDDLTASSEALESTNEELQSVNEALYTVNSECKRRIEELEETNTDLDNLLRVVDVGVLLLDESLMIRRFNSSATRLLPLRPEDVGRPLTEIALQADYPSFAKDVREVLSLGIRKAASVLALDGAWWSIGVRTARDSSSRVAGGVIVTMHEISELRRAISELSRLKQVHEIAEDASGIGHAVLDLAHEVVHFSEGARRLLGFPEGVMSASLERSLGLFGVATGEEQGLALDGLRDGRGLPASFEAEVRVLDEHPVRLRVEVFAKTEASTGSRLVFALLTRPG
jgi:two-component system CheB/CheR fusion protein